jgi:NADH:ubiquinone oxidoreductase subunit F (NADH-binding)
MRSAVADAPSELGVARQAGIRSRLLSEGGSRTEGGVDYRAAGGYGPGAHGPELLDAIAAAGLRGRGGAAFPTAAKLRAVVTAPAPRYLVANGAEGEPASAKDRFLTRHRPHLVIDGVLRVAEALEAQRAYIYVCDQDGARSLRAALLDPLVPDGVPVEVVEGPPGYVTGEETAVVRAIDGGPSMPMLKPPRPFEAGVSGRPTAMVNVETLAHVPFIATAGPARFRELGTESSPGTLLVTLSGAVREPGLYEVQFGSRLRDVIEELAGGPAGVVGGVLFGGFFGGILSAEHALGLRLSYEDLLEAGSTLGCGAIVVLGEKDCPVVVATEVMAYFAVENARQCGPCFRGVETLRDVLGTIMAGTAGEDAIERLHRVMPAMIGRGVCATPDAAVALVASVLREFPDLVRAHLAQRCPRCASANVDWAHPGRRFAVDPPPEGNSAHAHRH